MRQIQISSDIKRAISDDLVNFEVHLGTTKYEPSSVRIEHKDDKVILVLQGYKTTL